MMMSFIKSLKIKSFSLVLLLSLIFVSCDIFDLPVKEYLEKSMSSPYFSGFTLSVPSATDSAGYSCVGSSEDLVITYSISNPRNLALKAELSFPSGSGATAGSADAAGNTTFTLSGNSAVLTIPEDVLSGIDGDTDKFDISPTVNLLAADESGVFTLSDSKTIRLRCNTVPSAVSNARAMMMPADNTLVVCLDMPVENTDAKYLNVYGHAFDLEDLQSGSGGWTISAFAPGTLNPTATGYDFSSSGGQAYYITTDISDLLNKALFTIGISVVDKGGLSSSVYSIPSKIVKLSAPVLKHNSAEVTAGEYSHETGEDYAEFTLEDTSGISGVKIRYTVSDSNGNSVYDSTGTPPLNLQLYPSEDGSQKTYTVIAASTSSNAQDSDEYSVSFLVKCGGSDLSVNSNAGTNGTETPVEVEAVNGSYEYKLIPSSDGNLIYSITKTGETTPSYSSVDSTNGDSVSADGKTFSLGEGTYNVSAKLKKTYHLSLAEFTQKVTVKINESSGGVEITTPGDLSFEASSSGSTYTITAKSENFDVTSSITSWSIVVLDSSGADVTSSAGFKVSVNTVALPADLNPGTYTIKIVAVYNGTSYSGSVQFTK